MRSVKKLMSPPTDSNGTRRLSRISSVGNLVVVGTKKQEERNEGEEEVHLTLEQQNEKFRELDRAKRVEKEAAKALHEKRLDDAFTLCNEALQMDPTLHGALRVRVQVHLKRKSWDDVIEDCSLLISSEIVHEMDWTDRAVAKLHKRDYPGTIADCCNALEMYPPYVRARYIRAQAKYYSDDFEGCVSDCDENIRLDCMDPYHWSLRGMAKVQLGAIDDYWTGGAIDDCNEAIKLDYKHYIAWSTRGDARNDRGDHLGATKDTKKALALYHKYADKTGEIRPYARVHSNRADALVSLGRLEEAEFHCSRALAMDPLLSDAWGRRGELKFSRGDLRGAIADTARAVELDHLDKDAYFCSSEAKLTIGDYDGAITDARDALRVDPNYDEAARVARVAQDYKRLLKVWRIPIVDEHIAKLHKDDTPSARLSTGIAVRRSRSAVGGQRLRLRESSASEW